MSKTLLISEYKTESQLFHSHHRNHFNKLIHIITIPFEWLSFTFFWSQLNLNWISTFLVSLYIYVCCPRNSKYLAIMGHLTIAIISDLLNLNVLSPQAKILGILLTQIISWFTQVIIGHWLIEKNNPSMIKKFTLNSIIFSLAIIWEF